MLRQRHAAPLVLFVQVHILFQLTLLLNVSAWVSSSFDQRTAMMPHGHFLGALEFFLLLAGVTQLFHIAFATSPGLRSHESHGLVAVQHAQTEGADLVGQSSGLSGGEWVSSGAAGLMPGAQNTTMQPWGESDGLAAMSMRRLLAGGLLTVVQ